MVEDTDWGGARVLSPRMAHLTCPSGLRSRSAGMPECKTRTGIPVQGQAPHPGSQPQSAVQTLLCLVQPARARAKRPLPVLREVRRAAGDTGNQTWMPRKGPCWLWSLLGMPLLLTWTATMWIGMCRGASPCGLPLLPFPECRRKHPRRSLGLAPSVLRSGDTTMLRGLRSATRRQGWYRRALPSQGIWQGLSQRGPSRDSASAQRRRSAGGRRSGRLSSP